MKSYWADPYIRMALYCLALLVMLMAGYGLGAKAPCTQTEKPTSHAIWVNDMRAHVDTCVIVQEKGILTYPSSNGDCHMEERIK